MVRAVLKDGAIQPLDPLPPEWREGLELCIERVGELRHDPAELERWSRELQSSTTGIGPEDLADLRRALEADDREQKALTSKRMDAQ